MVISYDSYLVEPMMCALQGLEARSPEAAWPSAVTKSCCPSWELSVGGKSLKASASAATYLRRTPSLYREIWRL